MYVERLLKTWAYAVCAACCATAFSSLGNHCRVNPKFSCTTYPIATIALTVASFLVAFVMLAMWLLAADAAAGLCPLASHVILVLLLVAVGMVSRAGDEVALGTIFVALVLALLLAVASWNAILAAPMPTKADGGPSMVDV